MTEDSAIFVSRRHLQHHHDGLLKSFTTNKRCFKYEIFSFRGSENIDVLFLKKAFILFLTWSLN